MRLMQQLISAGFATCALASASMPAFAWNVWPNPDFEWYANVGKPMAGTTYLTEETPAPREGYIWAPGRYVWTGSQHLLEAGRWIKDDYQEQVAAAINRGGNAVVVNEPMILRDRDGNVIPTQPEAYPIDSTTRR